MNWMLPSMRRSQSAPGTASGCRGLAYRCLVSSLAESVGKTVLPSDTHKDPIPMTALVPAQTHCRSVGGVFVVVVVRSSLRRPGLTLPLVCQGLCAGLTWVADGRVRPLPGTRRGSRRRRAPTLALFRWDVMGDTHRRLPSELPTGARACAGVDCGGRHTEQRRTGARPAHSTAGRPKCLRRGGGRRAAGAARSAAPPPVTCSAESGLGKPAFLHFAVHSPWTCIAPPDHF